jgi:hypothetical protein
MPSAVITESLVGVGASLPVAVAGSAVAVGPGASLVVAVSDVEAIPSTYSEL